MAHYTLCLSAEYQGQVVGERKKKKKKERAEKDPPILPLGLQGNARPPYDP